MALCRRGGLIEIIKDKNLCLPGVLSGRFLPLSSGLPLPPPFPNGPAILAPRCTTGPRGCHLQAVGRLGPGAAQLCAPHPGFSRGQVCSAPPQRGPWPAVAVILPPLPPAAAAAPHSSGLSNNFPSEGGWAGARRPGPLALGPSRGTARVASVGLLRGAVRSPVPVAAPSARIPVQSAAPQPPALPLGDEAGAGRGRSALSARCTRTA